jgi:hypothetical protein
MFFLFLTVRRFQRRPGICLHPWLQYINRGMPCREAMKSGAPH